ncbi:hypothetical protein P3X46_022683 [Hevea brasiliensis]|uniref:U1-type domain-containing protein n=1 Tax=Hevea brasiliensis TaxID=3981 RepID=A0ABQ9L8J5_HEVBR|nr:uncharacterized protein LOC110650243 [Hevea brasiliensis]KAJ9162953.1 hypothetical protein P3X46_022683 [Hevea brasiliensis]
MEFKFRAVDGKPPTLFSSSSTLGYFSEEAFRANYPNIDPRQNPELMRNQTLQCEIEKQRIREEIIAKEIARRRVLEAEVRRELMMEREMAMRVGIRDGGLSSEERLTMRLEQGAWFPCVNQFDNRRLEDRSAFHGHGVFDQWPRLSEALVLPDVKPVSEDNKDKLIVLAKPNSNLCGAKRKAATPPEQGAVGLPDAGLKKIPKEEWNCTLCNVSATSERGLNEHLQGKRHKAKEARLRANRVAKNLSPIPFPKKTAKPANLTTSIAGSELEAKVEGELLEVEKANDDTDKKRENKQDSGNANDKLQKCTYRKFEEKRGREIAEERTAEFRKKKQFKFWCEMCQIGAYSAVVM